MLEQTVQRNASRPNSQVVGKADLHIHSAAGDGMATPSEILEYVEEYTDLDIVAITDHDDVAGALEARELAARRRYRFEVVVGTEVTTLAGHLLALFIEERIPMFQPLDRTIEAVHHQGGICVVPHPMSWLTFSVGEVLLRRYARHESAELRLDGVESFNPSVAGWVCHKRARELNQECLALPEFGGSDAHQLHQIGTAYTLFAGQDVAGLMRALRNGTTSADGAFWSASSHLHGAAAQSWRSLVLHPGLKLYRAISRLSTDRATDKGMKA